MKPVSVDGYTIPPAAAILPNLYGLHHNKEYWGDPEVFRIERWINDKQQLLNHEGYFAPFCVGESMVWPLTKSYIAFMIAAADNFYSSYSVNVILQKYQYNQDFFF